jgi:ABC-2 type transport system ATP-binding protein
MAQPDDVIVVEGLVKQYGDKRALDGIDLRVPRGTVLGLLGPNGAGKTTLVRILATLAAIDEGHAWIDGVDLARDPEQVRYRIGLAGQHASVDEILSGRANLIMFGRLFHLSPRQARRRADELLEQFKLTEAAERRVRTYSGGMRRRLDLAASLLIAPTVLFLDEPTTGLDPRGRAEIWESVRSLVDAGTSVLLTTQYLDEADQLADHIAIIDRGTIVAEGTPTRLKSMIGTHLEVVVHDRVDLASASAAVQAITDTVPALDPEDGRVRAAANGGSMMLADVVRELDRRGVAIDDIAWRRPTLDEVFLKLTGDDPIADPDEEAA